MDCESKKGRLLDLCLCKGHDGRPDPRPEVCEQYARLGAVGITTSSQPPLLITPTRPKGVGDTIAKLTSKLGIAKFVKYVTKKLGYSDCGCSKRQAKLNQIFPYK